MRGARLREVKEGGEGRRTGGRKGEGEEGGKDGRGRREGEGRKGEERGRGKAGSREGEGGGVWKVEWSGRQN